MIAKIFKTKSAPNVVNKNLSEVVTFEEVIFKEDTSLLNPTIIINGVSMIVRTTLKTLELVIIFPSQKLTGIIL